MPELPEVETTLRGVAPHILQKTIAGVAVRNAQLRWPVPDLSVLHACQITSIQRRGKYLLIAAGDETLLIHLGMSGSLRIVSATEPAMVHDHVDMVFTDQTALRYSDPRRFGCWLLAGAEPMQHSLLCKLGPEPLTAAFTADYLYQVSRKRRVAVKQFIMNSQVVVGVGNIYANEALFMAGIHPQRQAGRISKARYEKLVSTIKAVLAQAIQQGGTTLRDFVGGDGEPGYFKQSLAVYGRGGESCINCQKPLIEVRMGQRTTVFCKFCQT